MPALRLLFALLFLLLFLTLADPGSVGGRPNRSPLFTSVLESGKIRFYPAPVGLKVAAPVFASVVELPGALAPVAALVELGSVPPLRAEPDLVAELRSVEFSAAFLD